MSTLITDFLQIVLSPVSITCAVISIGYGIGKIKFKGIGLDMSAILILAVLLGAIMSRTDIVGEVTADIFKGNYDSLKMLSSFGSSLFIASVGFTTGYTVSRINGITAVKYFALGIFMVLINCIPLALLVINKNTSEAYTVLGVFCGAMTSTPALTAICEGDFSVQAVTGYSSAYIFGVVGVVLFVQLVTRKNAQNTVSKTEAAPEHKSPTLLSIVQITTAASAGYCLNGLLRSLFDFSLGSSACILLVSLSLGLILKSNIRISDSVLQIFRNFGLALFLAATGIPAGEQFINSFSVNYVLYGMLLTATPVVVSYFAAKKILRLSTTDALFAVCGVMTSTPAVGVLLKNDDPSSKLSIYSLSYVGALLTLTVCASIAAQI